MSSTFPNANHFVSPSNSMSSIGDSTASFPNGSYFVSPRIVSPLARVTSIQAPDVVSHQEESVTLRKKKSGTKQRPKTISVPISTKSNKRASLNVTEADKRSKGRSTINSLQSGSGGFYHTAIIEKFNDARCRGRYDDNGCKETALQSVAEVERDLWTECRKLFSTEGNMYVDGSLWGNRDCAKRQVKGIQNSAAKFRIQLSQHLQKLEDSPEGKFAIYLIASQVTAIEDKIRLIHTNALIVQLKDGVRNFFVFDPFMPTEDHNGYLPVNFVVVLAREALRENDNKTMNIIFGKQQGTADCLHRSIDFIARVVEKNVSIHKIPSMPYKVTAKSSNRVVVPRIFYGGV